MKWIDIVRLFTLCTIGIVFIIVVGLFTYNNFIKIAPIREDGAFLIYNNIVYKEFYGDFSACYNTDKNLGNLKGSTYNVYTVKNDPDNNFLIMEDILIHRFYVKESIYEQFEEQNKENPFP